MVGVVIDYQLNVLHFRFLAVALRDADGAFNFLDVSTALGIPEDEALELLETLVKAKAVNADFGHIQMVTQLGRDLVAHWEKARRKNGQTLPIQHSDDEEVAAVIKEMIDMGVTSQPQQPTAPPQQVTVAGKLVHETVQHFNGASQQPRDDDERDRLLEEYASAGLSQPISLPPPDVQRRCEIGRSDQGRTAYALHGDDFMRWAGDNFKKRYTKHRRDNNNCLDTVEERKKFLKWTVDSGNLSDAKDFLKVAAGKKTDARSLHLALCAAEHFGFLRQFEAADRPPFPMPFVINGDGIVEAERVTKLQKAARKAKRKPIAKAATPSIAGDLDRIQLPAPAVAPQAAAATLQEPLAGVGWPPTINIHVDNSNTNTATASSNVAPTDKKDDEAKVGVIGRLRKIVVESIWSTVEAKIGVLVGAALLLVTGILFSDHSIKTVDAPDQSKDKREPIPTVNFDNGGRFMIAELKPGTDSFTVNGPCKAKFVLSTNAPNPLDLVFSIDETSTVATNENQPFVLTIADNVKSGFTADLTAGKKYRVRMPLKTDFKVSVTVVLAD